MELIERRNSPPSHPWFFRAGLTWLWLELHLRNLMRWWFIFLGIMLEPDKMESETLILDATCHARAKFYQPKLNNKLNLVNSLQAFPRPSTVSSRLPTWSHVEMLANYRNRYRMQLNDIHYDGRQNDIRYWGWERWGERRRRGVGPDAVCIW